MESNDDASGSISPLQVTVRAAARLAHNLRNLLETMGRCIDVIRAELPSGTAAESNLAELDRGIDRAFYLTRQLFNAEPPTARERVVVDLNQTVVNAKGMFGRALESTFTPEFRLVAREPRVVADPYELEWILLNLIMNSREAMPSGGRITIETADHVRAVNNHQVPVVRLTITDTGEKPPSETEDRVPLPLYDTSEIAAIRLGNVAVLVENLGGWLVVDYERGRGTTVHVDLPAA
jgi:two-component system, cell cycle sensor histidine kinase and response regulator CckA